MTSLHVATASPVFPLAARAQPAELDPPRIAFESVCLPGQSLSFQAHAGDIVHLAGGSVMAQLRVLSIAAGHGFGGPGHCRLFGLDVMALTPVQRLALRNHHIARVLLGEQLPATLPVLAGVAQAALQRGLSAHEALHRAALELDAVGLGEAHSLPPESLSTGQLRLAMLARALVLRPWLLLLERPETGTDPATLTRLSMALWAASAAGCCVLMTTEHPGLAASAHRRVDLDAAPRPVARLS